MAVVACATQEDVDLPTSDASTASGGSGGDVSNAGGDSSGGTGGAATGGSSATGGTSTGGVSATGGTQSGGTGGTAGSGGTVSTGGAGTGGTVGSGGTGVLPPGVDCTGVTELPCPGSQSTLFAIGTSQYCLNKSNKSWAVAVCMCRAWGGTLAAIETMAEQQALGARTDVSTQTWIGGYQQTQNQWAWTTGATVTYANWSAFEEIGSGQDCIAFYGYDDAWRSDLCTQTKDYLCEKQF